MAGVKKGSFAAATSTGNQAVTGVGFQPKALIVWATRQTATGFAADAALSFGFTDGTNQRCLSVAGTDNVATTAERRYARTDKTLCLLTGSGTVEVDAAIVSFDSDGFTLNFGSAGAGKDYLIHYLALGAAVVDSLAIGTFSPSGSTGDQDVTSAGLQGDLLLLLYHKALVSDGNTGTSCFMLGMASGSGSEQGEVSFRSKDGNSGQGGSMQHSPQAGASNAVFQGIGATLGSSGIATLSAWLSNGFRLNWSEAGDSGTDCFYLVLKKASGASIKVVTDTQKTSTGTKATTGLGFQPDGLLAFMHAADAQTDVSLHGDDIGLTVGATDGTTTGHTFYGEANIANPTNNDSRTDTSSLLVVEESPGSSTVTAEASLSSFDSDGFTLNWTTADANARDLVAAAFKAAPTLVATGAFQ